MGAGRGKARRAKFVNARNLNAIPDLTFMAVVDKILESEPVHDDGYARAAQQYRDFQGTYGTSIYFAGGRMSSTCATGEIWDNFGREVAPGEQPSDYPSLGLTDVYNINQTRPRYRIAEEEYEAREANAQRCNTFLEETARGLGIEIIDIPSEKKYPFMTAESKEDMRDYAQAHDCDVEDIDDLNFRFALEAVQGWAAPGNRLAINQALVQLKFPDATPTECRVEIVAHELSHALMGHDKEYSETQNLLQQLSDQQASPNGFRSIEHVEMVQETEAEFFTQQIMEAFNIANAEKHICGELRRRGLFSAGVRGGGEAKRCYERSARMAQDLLRGEGVA